MSTESINMVCTRCNSAKFRKPHDGEMQDDDVWTCVGCDGQITGREIRKQSADAVKKLLAETVSGMFKKR